MTTPDYTIPDHDDDSRHEDSFERQLEYVTYLTTRSEADLLELQGEYLSWREEVRVSRSLGEYVPDWQDAYIVTRLTDIGDELAHRDRLAAWEYAYPDDCTQHYDGICRCNFRASESGRCPS